MIFSISSHYFLSGGVDRSSYLNTILSFNKTEESWQPVGQMTVERERHAVEVINDVSQLCPWCWRQHEHWTGILSISPRKNFVVRINKYPTFLLSYWSLISFLIISKLLTRFEKDKSHKAFVFITPLMMIAGITCDTITYYYFTVKLFLELRGTPVVV